MLRPDTSYGSTRHRIYTYVLSYQEREHHAPSVRDICLGIGLKSTSTAQGHIDRMIRDGLLTRLDGRCRTLWAKPGALAIERGKIDGQSDSAL